MGFFRIPHIALTVSLVVATATQPVAGLRAAQRCDERAAGNACAECGHCEVQDSEKRKRCGCCESGESNDAHAACSRLPQSDGVSAERQTLKPLAAALRASVCLCGHAPEPAGEDRQHHRTGQDNVRHDLDLSADYPVQHGGRFAVRRPVRLDARGNQDHFSQRVLGVWRN